MRTFEEVYKEWRNQARKFNANLLLHRCLREMQRLPSEGMDLIRGAPWHLLLMVKWICQDEKMHDQSCREISDQQFSRLRNELWNLKVAFPDAGGLDLFMRRAFRPQLAFQKGPSMGFLRDLSLIEDLPASSQLRRSFEHAAGVSVQQFIDLSIATFAFVVNGRLNFRLDQFAPLIRHHGQDAVIAYLRNFTASWPELKSFCRSRADAKKKVASEYYEFPAISRFPFLLQDGWIRCWHQTVLYRAFDNVVYNMLSESSFNYMEAFGRVFERHVVAALELPGFQAISEGELRAHAMGSEVCDRVLLNSECQILIEVKASIFPEDVQVAGDAGYFARNTRPLQKAIRQGVATCSLMRQKRAVRGDLPTYQLVVTNKQIGVLTARRLMSMFPGDWSLLPDDSQLPLDNIFFMPQEDLERIIYSVQDGTLELGKFLARCVADQFSPATSVFEFGQLLDRYGAGRRSDEYASAKYQAALSRMRAYME